MKILLLGAAGFIGTNLTIELAKKTEDEITLVDRVNFGRGFTFRKGFNLVVSKEGKVEIGENCFFNNGCSINCLNHIEIGEGSIFGEGVRIYDHNHRFADFSKPIKEQGYSQGSVKVGKHCWVGSNVVLLKGADPFIFCGADVQGCGTFIGRPVGGSQCR